MKEAADNVDSSVKNLKEENGIEEDQNEKKEEKVE
jgi:hypothetical protein